MKPERQFNQPLEADFPYENAVFDETGSSWEKIQENIIAKYRHIVALRGAGSNNGIDREAAEGIINEQLIPRVASYIADGSVALMFDGDSDDVDKPDIGFIMGRLRDAFDQEDEDKILFVAAQKMSWYYPHEERANLSNASGKEYNTVVFPDRVFPGDHNSFTQSEVLANVPGYEQWYIGASGPIASEQLEDMDTKIEEGRRKVVMFPAPINADLSEEINSRLRLAQEARDEVKAQKLIDVIQQRQRKFGSHFDESGKLTIDRNKYPNLDFEVVSI
jgi:hypothetical protein